MVLIFKKLIQKLVFWENKKLIHKVNINDKRLLLIEEKIIIIIKAHKILAKEIDCLYKHIYYLEQKNALLLKKLDCTFIYNENDGYYLVKKDSIIK